LKALIGFFLAGIAAVAFAQTGRIDPTAPAAEVVAVVDFEQLPRAPTPEEIKKILPALTVAADGFSWLSTSAKEVDEFLLALRQVRLETARTSESGHSPSPASGPNVYTDLSTLRLPFEPASFDGGELIGATSEATAVPGLERYFWIPGAGHARLREADVPNTEGRVYFLKILVNANVNGKPAVSRVLTGDDGAIMEEIVWGDGRKIYDLTYLPWLAPTDHTNAVPVISAYSLAQRVH
jgi:hypothetical protein